MQRTFTRSILMTMLLAAGAWQAAQAAPQFAQEVPTTYPKFEEGAGSLTLVVAELMATDYLKGYDCKPSQARRADGGTTLFLCPNPPPTWFKARTLQQVAGADIGDAFYAVTGSHYGAMKIGAAEPARLMLLRSDGTALEMLRYKSWPVVKSRDGQYHLVVQDGPISWLPCWAASLVQEIDHDQFATDLSIPRDEYDSRWAAQYASFYRVTADSVRPRYAIPVAGLQQQLKTQPLAAADFSCTKPVSAP